MGDKQFNGLKQNMKTQILEAKIIDGGETYLACHSVFPVYMSEEADLYIVEEYEKGHPCEHMVKDLQADGVVFEIAPIGTY